MSIARGPTKSVPTVGSLKGENMIDKNPCLDTRDGKSTPLHVAAKRGCFEMCQLIVMEIDNKNPKDFQGYTPLHYAAEEGHYQICKLFIKNGMQLNVKNNSDKMPLTLAYEKGHENVIDLIGYESYTQNLDLGNTLGNTTKRTSKRK